MTAPVLMKGAALEAAREWAKDRYQMEAAGLFVEADGGHEFLPCPSPCGGAGRFFIPPAFWLEAEGRGKIIGVFHSHCDSGPLPSAADAESMEAWGLPWAIMSVPSMEWAEYEPGGAEPRPLLGRQFEYGAADCFGLIRDYYSRLGVNIPNFERWPGWEGEGHNLYLDNCAAAGFSVVTSGQPRLHDILLMRLNSPVPNHGAIYLGGGRILHHVQGRLSARALWGAFFRRATTHILRYGVGAPGGFTPPIAPGGSGQAPAPPQSMAEAAAGGETWR